ncbi:hypothetical protein PIROE2DRAFT_18267 [Piromyces sp. E2]|nr:hypothetical protein PIROE2DRAFT_18267 [Piromyces sp. E2]|eukprot:OUM56915.1 hypothetical protein PIROE2DRAFT_18267 [Piromyces sp. E2]
MAAIKISDHFNYTKLLKFTIPTIVMLILSSIYGVVDGTFISNCAGSDSFAAVNIVWPIVNVFGAVGIMIGSGGSALVSKTMGENKKEKAVKYFSMLIYFEIIIGVILSVIGSSLLRPLAKLMGAEGNVLEYGISYGRIIYITFTAYILQNSFQSFMVAAEKPKLGLLISVTAGIVNMLFDFILIYLCKMGVKGAAIATALSQCVGGLLPLTFFMCKNSTNYRLIKTGLEFKPILKACSNGLSGMVMVMSLSIINMLYNFQLLRWIGPKGVTVYGIIQYILCIFGGFLMGYSQGSVPIISYHYGAQNVDEIQNLLKRGLVIIFTASLIFFGITEALAPVVAKIFVLSGYNSFSSSFFTGLNNGKVAAIISISRMLIFESGSIFILPLMFGLNGIWMAVTVAETISEEI